jgi:glycosyltransferase involved in cell wall biosynthesis
MPDKGAWPRITVVTPGLNSVELIEDCIRSVLDQRYPALEYIVIDGGSTDGTVDVVQEHENSLAFWISEPDRGQADAINKGFRRATGEIVTWLNSDDFLYPGALEAVAEAYHADPLAPFYFGNGFRVTKSGKKIGEFFPADQVHFRRDALMFGLNCVLQPAAFIRRSALEQVGLLDESLHFGFDSNLWLELSALGQPRPIRRHLAASREYGTTKTAAGGFPRAEELRQIAERHAGIAATPGSIAYYLHTLHRLALERPDVFPNEYADAIATFWQETAKLFARYGAGPTGFPLPETLVESTAEAVAPKTRTRVGIELRQVSRGVSGGITVVLAGTLTELFRQRPDLEFVVFCTVFNRDLLASDEPNVEFVTLPLSGYFDELADQARARSIDLFIRSYPTVEEVDFPLKRQIFVVPDVQHEDHPEFFDSQSLELRRKAFLPVYSGAGAIMTISEFARKTIERCSADDRDVFVASPTLPPDFLAARSDDTSAEERILVDELGPFFFFPANLWPHKNHRRLLQAFGLFLGRSGIRAELVLTGSSNRWQELRDEAGDLPVRHLGFISAPMMRLLYERAIALTFFSEYEGFGIPLLEAFACGTPVVCSDTTSLPEVAGDAALMCDPTDVEAMYDLLMKISSDEQVRAGLVERGRARLAAYSWEDAARELSAGIDRVLERATRHKLGDTPLVSIVTPSYNQGRFIRTTIESVLGQTYPYVEYVVVDGGSTDGTVEILREYGDRFRWTSEPDSGQTNAINKGLAAARGEIVAYLNSDDVLLPDAVASVVAYLRAHPECDLVYGDADIIDEEGRVTGSFATADYSFERLMADCCICQPATFWRAAVAERAGLFDETVQYAMDFDYWIRIDRSGFELQHLPSTLAQARAHEQAKTTIARPAIYREIVAVSRRSGGYVSQGYIHGLWHHLAHERRYHPARLLRPFPRLRGRIATVHYRWLNRRQYSWRQRIAGARRVAKQRLIHALARTPRLLALLVRFRRGLRRAAASARSLFVRSEPPAVGVLPAGRPRVSGFWPDNWVTDRLDVVIGPRESAREVRILGRAVVGMSVEVSADGDRLGRFELEGSREEAVVVKVPPGPLETISFQFSDAVVDGSGRMIAFRLDATNLFSEADIAARV